MPLCRIRNALADFKKSGKWIIAYGDALSQGGYYLASVANKVYVNPEGNVDFMVLHRSYNISKM